MCFKFASNVLECHFVPGLPYPFQKLQETLITFLNPEEITHIQDVITYLSSIFKECGFTGLVQMSFMVTPGPIEQYNKKMSLKLGL